MNATRDSRVEQAAEEKVRGVEEARGEREEVLGRKLLEAEEYSHHMEEELAEAQGQVQFRLFWPTVGFLDHFWTAMLWLLNVLPIRTTNHVVVNAIQHHGSR
jgi:hypothetical protein